MRHAVAQRRSCITRRSRITLALVLAAWAAPLHGGPLDGTPVGPNIETTPAPLVEPARDLPRRSPEVTLFVFDIKNLIGAELPHVTNEVSAIFDEMGVTLGWRKAGLGTLFGAGEARELPVILLDRPVNPKAASADVLGMVPKNANPMAVYVFLDHIRRAARIKELDALRPDGARALAIATGRVIAHELVHALAPHLAHTSGGLMRASLDASMLVGPLRPSLIDCAASVRGALEPAQPARQGTPLAFVY